MLNVLSPCTCIPFHLNGGVGVGKKWPAIVVLPGVIRFCSDHSEMTHVFGQFRFILMAELA